jgi:hypothetical protein
MPAEHPVDLLQVSFLANLLRADSSDELLPILAELAQVARKLNQDSNKVARDARLDRQGRLSY